MLKREQIVTVNDVPVAEWRDQALRETLFGRWLAQAREIAAAKDMTIIGDTPDQYGAICMRLADDGNGGTKAVSCTEPEAEFARVRATWWAQ